MTKTLSALMTLGTAAEESRFIADFLGPTLAHFSRFIAPGARRVAAEGNGVAAAAFANPDGSLAVVLGNPYLSSRTIRVILDNQAADVEVPAEGAVTLILNKE